MIYPFNHLNDCVPDCSFKLVERIEGIGRVIGNSRPIAPFPQRTLIKD